MRVYAHVYTLGSLSTQIFGEETYSCVTRPSCIRVLHVYVVVHVLRARTTRATRSGAAATLCLPWRSMRARARGTPGISVR